MDEEKRTGSWDKNGIKVIVVWSRLVQTTFKTELFFWDWMSVWRRLDH